jgi:hypothetical protein
MHTFSVFAHCAHLLENIKITADMGTQNKGFITHEAEEEIPNVEEME